MAGLIGTGLQYRQQANILAKQADELALRREQETQMQEAAKKQTQGTLAGTGAAIGAMSGIGTGAAAGSAFSPVGALIGAGIGYLAGSFL